MRTCGSSRPTAILYSLDNRLEAQSCNFAKSKVIEMACERRGQRRSRMRVIAGKFRSRPLHSLRGMDLRPTADRLRETLFNVLAAGNPSAFEGNVWLDLCAGTGRGRY